MRKLNFIDQRRRRVSWKELLRKHPVFLTLKDTEIDQLLSDQVSEEIEFDQGNLILRQGDSGQSIFFIGAGSVRVLLPGNDEHVTLSILGKGEFFGEMAILEHKPRAATLVANERCTLLEIRAETFLYLMAEHPEIEFKILLKLSERLRHANEQIMEGKLKDVDEKLKLFDIKLTSQIKVVDASLKAAQAVFDQTKIRTDEVINCAERSRTRLTVAASAAATILTTVVALFGWFGFKQLLDITQLRVKVEEDVANIEIHKNALKELSEQMKEERNSYVQDYLLPSFTEALRNGDSSNAWHYYKRLQVTDTTPERILNEVEAGMIESHGDYCDVLLDFVETTDDYAIKIRAYYLLLTDAALLGREILPGDQTFESTLISFEKYVEPYRGYGVIDKKYLMTLEKHMATQPQRTRELFGRIRDLIPTG